MRIERGQLGTPALRHPRGSIARAIDAGWVFAHCPGSEQVIYSELVLRTIGYDVMPGWSTHPSADDEPTGTANEAQWNEAQWPDSEIHVRFAVADNLESPWHRGDARWLAVPRTDYSGGQQLRYEQGDALFVPSPEFDGWYLVGGEARFLLPSGSNLMPVIAIGTALTVLEGTPTYRGSYEHTPVACHTTAGSPYHTYGLSGSGQCYTMAAHAIDQFRRGLGPEPPPEYYDYYYHGPYQRIYRVTADPPRLARVSTTGIIRLESSFRSHDQPLDTSRTNCAYLLVGARGNLPVWREYFTTDPGDGVNEVVPVSLQTVVSARLWMVFLGR